MAGRVLIIEERPEIRQIVRKRLESEDMVVTEAATGDAGLQAAKRSIPQAILLSTSLPDHSGIEVAKALRSINRLKHVFLMLVGDEDNRTERLAGLEAGANDFVTRPIDPDLVMLRLRNAIHRANLDNNTDPTTGMPSGRRVQEELMRLVRHPEGDWVFLRCHVRHLEALRERRGFLAADEILRSVAAMLAGALSRDEIEDDFLGYGGQNDFIVITRQGRADALVAEVKAAFAQELSTYDGNREREAGYVGDEGERTPLAELRVRRVTPDEGPFYDIRSLSEALGPVNE